MWYGYQTFNFQPLLPFIIPPSPQKKIPSELSKFFFGCPWISWNERLLNDDWLPFSKGELESAVKELEECNCKLAALRAERDVTKGAFFPVLNLGNKHVAGDRVRDEQRDLRDMESVHKELMVFYDYSFSSVYGWKKSHFGKVKHNNQHKFHRTKLRINCWNWKVFMMGE